MVDAKQSFRRGKTITVCDVAEDGTATMVPTTYKSINQAKKANRVTKYAVAKVKVS